MKPKLRRELTVAKIAQHEPVTDHELEEVGLSPPPDAGWWYDPRDYTWRWVSPALERLIDEVKLGLTGQESLYNRVYHRHNR